MSVSRSTKLCPRCQTLLPARTTFCGSCGLPISALDDDATSRERHGSQTWWPSKSQRGDTSSGPGSAATAVAARPKKGRAGKIIALALVLLVLGGGGAAWFLYLSPSHVDSPLFDRHGLPGNVPLPDGTSFAGLRQTAGASDPQTRAPISADFWGWTVSGSDAAAVQTFYHDNLPEHGWTNVKFSNDSEQGKMGITACQSGQVLSIVASGKKLEVTDVIGYVTNTITPPGGGSALLIEMINSPRAAQVFCADASIP
jgi:hypothetical protein